MINYKNISVTFNVDQYKEAGKLSVHYATFPALLPYSCRVYKEQNDQIQESDAGASVRVSGQNRPCVAVCSMSHRVKVVMSQCTYCLDMKGGNRRTGKGCYPAQCILVPGPCNMYNKQSIFGTMDN